MSEAWESEERDDRGRFSGGGSGGSSGSDVGRERLDALGGRAAEISAGNASAEVWAAASPLPHVETHLGYDLEGNVTKVAEYKDASGYRSEAVSEDPNGPHNLAVAEQTAVGSYAVGSNGMNSALRGGDPQAVQFFQQRIESTDAAIARAEPTEAPTTLYRGILAVRGEPAPPTNYSQMQPGETFRDPGFVSTSTREEFAASWGGRSGGGELLEIHAPAGSQGLSTNVAQGSYSHEEEVILPRGSEFRVAEQLPDRTVVHLVPGQ